MGVVYKKNSNLVCDWSAVSAIFNRNLSITIVEITLVPTLLATCGMTNSGILKVRRPELVFSSATFAVRARIYQNASGHDPLNSVIYPRLSEMGHFRSVQFSSYGEIFSQNLQLAIQYF